jgi:uncharacterized protein
MDTIQQWVLPTIYNHFPHVQAIYLFGSYFTPYENTQSDIDIALLLPHSSMDSTTTQVIQNCIPILMEQTQRPIHLVSLRHVSVVFAHEIIFSGRILFVRDQHAVAVFEMLTMSLYQKLNEERRGILESIRQSRRVLNHDG